MKSRITEEHYVFESSYEVCNKVGGIYTVLATKLPHMVRLFGDRYYLIGPYVAHNNNHDFLESALPEQFTAIAHDLANEGIRIHYGQWVTTSGEGRVFLLDYSNFWSRINEYKKLIWDVFGVDSLNAPHDYDDVFIFGIAVGRLLERIAQQTQNSPLIFHFHEWLLGSALLYLKYALRGTTHAKLIFTTHATVLGRSITNSGGALYENIDHIDAVKEARNLNIVQKYSLERASIVQCDRFSTVSSITSLEAQKLYGRAADMVCPNGLDIKNLSTFEEVSFAHNAKRELLRQFLFYFFFPFYRFEVENTLFYFTSGRCEYRDKGYDILVKALGALNRELKYDRTCNTTVVAFFAVPSENNGPKPELFGYKEKFEEIKRLVTEHQNGLLARFMYSLMEKKQTDFNFLLSEKIYHQIATKIQFFKRENGTPFLSTHEVNEDRNPFIADFKKYELLNRFDDKVKVILIPSYLTGQDGLLNMTYSDLVAGAHFGIFPSYYEPFGYTPLEAMSLGVSALTTDLSGYGQFIESKIINQKYPGVFLLKRLNKDENSVITELTQILKRFAYFNLRQRVENKMNAIQLAGLSDWRTLVENYRELYKM